MRSECRTKFSNISSHTHLLTFAHLCRSYPYPGSIAMITFFHASRLCARSGSSVCCFRSLCNRSIHLSLGLPRGLFPPTFIVVTCLATFVSSLLITWPNHERRFWVTYGQGSQKLYNWPKILSPPHYRNGVHHTVEIICLYCGELRDVSENI